VSKTDDHTMRDFEVALMDALRTICEVLVAKQIVPVDTLAEMFRRQRESYPKEEMAGAVFVMNKIVDTLTDPARTSARKLVNDPAEGSA
jgi:hypothetical protein